MERKLKGDRRLIASIRILIKIVFLFKIVIKGFIIEFRFDYIDEIKVVSFSLRFKLLVIRLVALELVRVKIVYHFSS